VSKPISNPFLFVGKQIKDEYGRQIGRVASFKVTPTGRIDGVFVEHGDGEFLSYSNEQIKIDNGNLVVSPTIKLRLLLCVTRFL
jgi:sporulation protein YlmC with PRC-barrel domain